MSEVYEKLMKCYKSVREKTDFVPEAALHFRFRTWGLRR